MTASVARPAASTPIPPQTATVSPCSKKVKSRPPCWCGTRPQCLMSGLSSRWSAATMATLGIGVGPKPLYGTTESIVSRQGFPSKLALGFGGTGPHFFLAHAHSFDGGARLAAEQATSDILVHEACRISYEVGELNARRREMGDGPELVENLFER